MPRIAALFVLAFATLALPAQALKNQEGVERHHVETPVDRVGNAQLFIEDALPRLGNQAVEQLGGHLLHRARPLQDAGDETAQW